MAKAKKIENLELKKLFRLILEADSSFYSVVIIYGIAISILTLAVPISVQALLGTVINLALLQPILILTGVLFILLIFSGILNALQTYVIEIFERKFFARMTREIVLRNIYAKFSLYEKINRSEIINRYFEIFNVQKSFAFLLTSTVSLFLQTFVGILIVSFYHPFLLIFNVLLLTSYYLIWRIWGNYAIEYSLQNSSAKYKMARWLEDIARCNSFYKSENNILYALEKSDDITNEYIATKENYFNVNFKQIIAFLFIYALASSALLGVGGSLVINGQLTTGQLVAAELILSTILFSMSKLGSHLTRYYDLCASVEKLSVFFEIPTEEEKGKLETKNDEYDIIFDDVKYNYRDKIVNFDFKISQGSKIMISSEYAYLEKLFIHFLKNYRQPNLGNVYLGKNSISDYDIRILRQEIISIDTNLITEGTILNYLNIANPSSTNSQINEVLRLVEIDEIINSLDNGINTELSPSGYPLSENEVLKLKLAWALLAKPKAIIINSLFDTIAYHKRQRLIEKLCKIPGLTLLYFTNRKDAPYFDEYVFLENDRTSIFKTIDDFRNYEEKFNLKEHD